MPQDYPVDANNDNQQSRLCDVQNKPTDEEEDINPIVPSQRYLVEELKKANEEIRQRAISEYNLRETLSDHEEAMSQLLEELQRKNTELEDLRRTMEEKEDEVTNCNKMPQDYLVDANNDNQQSRLCDVQNKPTDEEEDTNPIVPSQRYLVEELKKANEEIRQRAISEYNLRETLSDHEEAMSQLLEELQRKIQN
ncbi:hypothetical protein WMY93_020911 [Mugilogobius chulae]|uniref:Uncharacterized protein n=1 Tax=Mugilogobius chulae TaxID=88201 RepID=A0AAW0NLI5_9GOBI